MATIVSASEVELVPLLRDGASLAPIRGNPLKKQVQFMVEGLGYLEPAGGPSNNSCARKPTAASTAHAIKGSFTCTQIRADFIFSPRPFTHGSLDKRGPKTLGPKRYSTPLINLKALTPQTLLGRFDARLKGMLRKSLPLGVPLLTPRCCRR